jgi:hypothetical protein
VVVARVGIWYRFTVGFRFRARVRVRVRARARVRVRVRSVVSFRKDET